MGLNPSQATRVPTVSPKGDLLNSVLLFSNGTDFVLSHNYYLYFSPSHLTFIHIRKIKVKKNHDFLLWVL